MSILSKFTSKLVITGRAATTIEKITVVVICVLGILNWIIQIPLFIEINSVKLIRKGEIGVAFDVNNIPKDKTTLTDPEKTVLLANITSLSTNQLIHEGSINFPANTATLIKDVDHTGEKTESMEVKIVKTYRYNVSNKPYAIEVNESPTMSKIFAIVDNSNITIMDGKLVIYVPNTNLATTTTGNVANRASTGGDETICRVVTNSYIMSKVSAFLSTVGNVFILAAIFWYINSYLFSEWSSKASAGFVFLSVVPYIMACVSQFVYGLIGDSILLYGVNDIGFITFMFAMGIIVMSIPMILGALFVFLFVFTKGKIVIM